MMASTVGIYTARSIPVIALLDSRHVGQRCKSMKRKVEIQPPLELKVKQLLTTSNLINSLHLAQSNQLGELQVVSKLGVVSSCLTHSSSGVWASSLHFNDSIFASNGANPVISTGMLFDLYQYSTSHHDAPLDLTVVPAAEYGMQWRNLCDVMKLLLQV